MRFEYVNFEIRLKLVAGDRKVRVLITVANSFIQIVERFQCYIFLLESEVVQYKKAVH